MALAHAADGGAETLFAAARKHAVLVKDSALPISDQVIELDLLARSQRLWAAGNIWPSDATISALKACGLSGLRADLPWLGDILGPLAAAVRPSDLATQNLVPAKHLRRLPKAGFLISLSNTDLAGRLCGWTLLSSKGTYYLPLLARQQDAGMVIHPELLTTLAPVIVTPEPLQFLRWQTIAAVDGTSPAPVVLFMQPGLSKQLQTGPTSWQQLHGRKLVFWASAITADLLREAIRYDGYLPTPGRWKTSQTAQLEAGTVIANAVPWATAVARLVQTYPTHETAQLISMAVKGSPQLRNRLLQHVDAGTRTHIHNFLSALDGQQRPVYRIDNKEIEERGGALYWHKADGQEELIASASIRLDSAIHYTSLQQVWYQGKITCDTGESFNFRVQRELLEKQMLPWMRDFLLEKGVFLRHNPAWSRRLYALMTTLAAPKYIKGADTIGWDAAKSRLVLPTSTLLLGAAKPKRSQVPLPEESPGCCRLLDPADFVVPQILRKLAPRSRAAIIRGLGWWVASILSPAVGRVPPERLLAASVLARKTVQLVGAATRSWSHDLRSEPWKVLVEKSQRHAWPLVADATNNSWPQNGRILRSDAPGSRLCLKLAERPWLAIWLSMSSYGWQLLESLDADSAHDLDADKLQAPVAQVCGAYLRLCVSGGQIAQWSQDGNLAEEVSLHLAKWLHERGLPRTDASYPDPGAELLRLVRRELHPNVLRQDEHKNWILSERGLERAFQRQVEPTGMDWSIADVREYLQKQDAIQYFSTGRGRKGRRQWVLKKRYVTDRLPVTGEGLRVVGA